MVIAVLGATGQLGSELLELWGEAAVGRTREELDLSDPSTIEAAKPARAMRRSSSIDGISYRRTGKYVNPSIGARHCGGSPGVGIA